MKKLGYILTIVILLSFMSVGAQNYFPSSGKVGIGDASPDEVLHLKSTGPVRLKIEADTDNTIETDNAQILFSQDGGAVFGMLGYGDDSNTFEIRNDWNSTDADIAFFTKNEFRAIIDGNGRIGIGNTSPLVSLDVSTGPLSTNGMRLISSESKALQFLPHAGQGYYTSLTRTHDAVIVASGGRGLMLAVHNSEGQGLRLAPDGNVGIATATPDHKLDVNGTVRAKEVIVETNWSDFVFEEGYELRSLQEVADHIEAHGHLPDVPSAAHIQENGLAVAEAQTLMMQKIEELTLYVIEQDQAIKEKDERIYSLEERLVLLESILIERTK